MRMVKIKKYLNDLNIYLINHCMVILSSLVPELGTAKGIFTVFFLAVSFLYGLQLRPNSLINMQFDPFLTLVLLFFIILKLRPLV